MNTLRVLLNQLYRRDLVQQSKYQTNENALVGTLKNISTLLYIPKIGIFEENENHE